MFINSRAKLRRRGVVLILVLGMLGLLALIGVTFCTFSGQGESNEGRKVAAAGGRKETCLNQYCSQSTTTPACWRR